jgi:hypothetical protein
MRRQFYAKLTIGKVIDKQINHFIFIIFLSIF